MRSNSLVIVNKELVRLNILKSGGVLFITIFLCLWYPFTLLFLLLIPVILGFYQGIEFDPILKRYRIFKGFYLLKRGEWKEIKESYSLVILSKSGRKEVTGTMLVGQYSGGQEGFYELYLMGSNHRNRVFIDTSKKIQKIQELAESIGKEMAIPIEKYNPV